MDRPVDRVAVHLDATVPDTASVEVDVRGRATGRNLDRVAAGHGRRPGRTAP